MPVNGGGGTPAYPTEGCCRFDLLLQDYLEGQDCPEVASHAAECGFCAALLGDLLLLQAGAGEIGEIGEEDPPARLWSNVRAQLAQEGLIRSPRGRAAWAQWFLRPIPAGGLAAVLLAGSVLILRSGGYLHRVSPPSVIPITEQGDAQLEANVADMERAFHERSSSLSPGIRSAFEDGLKALDLEIKECRTALSRAPNDALAREYLASAYDEKARVLASALEAGDDR